MMETIKELWKKHRSVLLYVIFGGLTTLVDWGIRFAFYAGFAEQMEQSPLLLHAFDVIAWIGAILFAFVTNRIWVFESKKRGFRAVTGELFSFAGGRVLTLLLQEALMFVFCTWLRFNEYVITVVAAVLVVILNYFISKFFVFRKKKEQ